MLVNGDTFAKTTISAHPTERPKKLEEWANKWGMRFNASKCYILSIKNTSNHFYQLNDTIHITFFLLCEWSSLATRLKSINTRIKLNFVILFDSTLDDANFQTFTSRLLERSAPGPLHNLSLIHI